MKHITILVPDGQVNLGTPATIVGVKEILAEANKYIGSHGPGEGCRVQLAGVTSCTGFADGMAELKPEVLVTKLRRSDLVIVPPSAIRDAEKLSNGNKAIVRWIVKQYQQGAEIASMCSGAFMLASSGILTARSCSTHWALSDAFRSAFPGVDLKEGQLITHEAGIYTNGGAYSFLNLALVLVEKYYNKATAIYCAKMFQIDTGRQSQSVFSIFTGHKKHDDSLVLQAQEYIERHYKERISVESLSQKLNIGRRNFDRRFVRATGTTPLDYLQRVKVEVAKSELESQRKTVSEVMYAVGYNDEKAFREVFSRIAGMSPVSYKAMYSKRPGLGY